MGSPDRMTLLPEKLSPRKPTGSRPSRSRSPAGRRPRSRSPRRMSPRSDHVKGMEAQNGTLPRTPSASSSAVASDAETVASISGSACVQVCSKWGTAVQELPWESLASMSGAMLKGAWRLVVIVVWVLYHLWMLVADLVALPLELFSCWQQSRGHSRYYERSASPFYSVHDELRRCPYRGQHRIAHVAQRTWLSWGGGR